MIKMIWARRDSSETEPVQKKSLYLQFDERTEHRVVVDETTVNEWVWWRRSLRKNDFGNYAQFVLNRPENWKKGVPRSTMYKKHWGVRIFEEWQAERENKLVMSEKNHAV